jgi:hypothetical protein
MRKGLDGIEVAELLNGRGNYEFDWEVKAVRKEHRDFQVYRPWDEVMPGGTDPAEAWEARLKSIQERQARQQAGTNTRRFSDETQRDTCADASNADDAACCCRARPIRRRV